METSLERMVCKNNLAPGRLRMWLCIQVLQESAAPYTESVRAKATLERAGKLCDAKPSNVRCGILGQPLLDLAYYGL